MNAPDTAPTSTDEYLKGLWRENPVFVTVLGMCPTLAVSNSARNALAMGLATTVVLAFSGATISAVRRIVPNQVRIATFIVIIASIVTAVEYLIQALSLELHKALGAFIALIVVNCQILGRAEAFASRNRVLPALMDGLGTGSGFTFALLCLGTVREILGNGTIFGVELFGPGFQPWVLLVLPSGGFFTLAAWMILFNHLKQRAARRRATAGEATA
jgi:electron transport complex protein RnfE